MPNALNDLRFRLNPLATGQPSIRLYAGHPLHINGFPIGTLCLLHGQDRELSEAEQTMLRDLTRWRVRFQRFQNTHTSRALRVA